MNDGFFADASLSWGSRSSILNTRFMHRRSRYGLLFLMATWKGGKISRSGLPNVEPVNSSWISASYLLMARLGSLLRFVMWLSRTRQDGASREPYSHPAIAAFIRELCFCSTPRSQPLMCLEPARFTSVPPPLIAVAVTAVSVNSSLPSGVAHLVCPASVWLRCLAREKYRKESQQAIFAEPLHYILQPCTPKYLRLLHV